MFFKESPNRLSWSSFVGTATGARQLPAGIAGPIQRKTTPTTFFFLGGGPSVEVPGSAFLVIFVSAFWPFGPFFGIFLGFRSTSRILDSDH